ncbi:MAG: GGDEF domain-containing protein [Clostridia bacterium]|nr:GGDEF domain-containing protein [Clostridia bacterium]
MKKKIALLTTGWSCEYIFAVLDGIKKAVSSDEVDLYLFICYGYYDETKAFNHGEYNIFSLAHYEDFDGVILFSNIFNSIEVLEREKARIIASKTPVISLEYKLDGIDYIGTDNYSGMYEITEHLISVHGLRDLAFIGGPDDNSESLDRKRAFLDAMAAHHLTPDEKNIITGGNWSYDFGYDQMLKMIRESKKLPEGIVCVNDEGTLGAITCLHKNGIRVPRDIVVVGFDDTQSAAAFTPSISTVNRNWSELGVKAIEHLNKLINKEPVEPVEMLKSSAVFRQSCGCVSEQDEVQKNNSLDLFHQQRVTLSFNRHVRHLQEYFIEETEPSSLWSQIQHYLKEHHEFEGDEFCILMERSSMPEEINVEERAKRKDGYSEELLKTVHIKDQQIQKSEIVYSRELIPKGMNDDRNNLYMFVPFHFQDQVIGYFVNKNSTSLIENRFCYDWSKGISNGFTLFYQKYLYTLTNKELTTLYMKDAMTGLFNRLGYKKLAYEFFQENRDKQEHTVIIFADINYMKGINDQFGHLHGDLAIKTVAEILQQAFPSDWLGFRYGGDEYLYIGSGQDEEVVDQYCSNASTNLERRAKRMSLPYHLSISIGYQIVRPQTDLTLDEAVKLADETMYRHKEEFHSLRKEL